MTVTTNDLAYFLTDLFTTHNIITFSITTLSTKGLMVVLSINNNVYYDTRPNDNQNNDTQYNAMLSTAFLIVMVSVVMLSVVTPIHPSLVWPKQGILTEGKALYN